MKKILISIATLQEEKVQEFNEEHMALLSKTEGEMLRILHQITYKIFKVSK